MITPTRIFWISVLIVLAVHPCRGSISVNWLDEPIVLHSPLPPVYEAIDLNGDSIIDFTFLANVSFVGVRAEDENQYLVWPNPRPSIGGNPEPLSNGFELGPNSGDGELDWFGTNTDFSTLIRCLDGSCSGRFRGNHAYMGVGFDVHGATHYGWIYLLVAEDNPYAEIYGWAYETQPGVSIPAGVVPEPSTLLLLLAGFGALAIRRKRIR